MLAGARLLLSARQSDTRQTEGVPLAWTIAGSLVLAFAGALTLISPRFDYTRQVIDMPVLLMTGGLALAGLVYAVGLPRLVRGFGPFPSGARPVILWMIAVGLAARLILFASEPILEDDYQRYLWDGAVTAHGFNPYAVAPEDASELADPSARSGDARPDGPSAEPTAQTSARLAELARESGPVLDRVNHPELRTVYPPVAQGAFALAYIIQPWSLAAWRSIILVCDGATLALMVLLLRDCGRSPLWAALYWWNPLLLKEFFNAAHVDALVLPLVLLALWLATRKRSGLAAATLMAGAGVKIWPALLLPLVLRPIFSDQRRLAWALLAVAGLGALLAAPVLSAPLDETSGFVAYLDRWRTNSALFPVVEQTAALVLGALNLSTLSPGWAARAVIALVLGGTALALSRPPVSNTQDLMARAGLLVAACLLLSPAQFPWYALWLAPFLAFRPWTGFLLLTATIPLYYAGFHFLAREERTALAVIPWLVWVPVWIMLLREATGSGQPAAGLEER